MRQRKSREAAQLQSVPGSALSHGVTAKPRLPPAATGNAIAPARAQGPRTSSPPEPGPFTSLHKARG